MTYRSNQEFQDSQKKGVPELTIFLDNVKHCTITADNKSSELINTISRCYPDKVIRIEKGRDK